MNKDKLGFEMNLKHILMRVKNNSLAEEKRVNEEMKKVRRRLEGGESFESLAIALSEDPATANKGGDLGWVVIAELDPYMATQVFRLNQPGQLSGVIKSSYGYHIVKFLGKRPITYDAVENKIFNLLFQQKITEQFAKWVVQRRRVSEVKIYMSDYKRG
jgi:peptidyl-prolyl cis-trans isomerase SurA